MNRKLIALLGMSFGCASICAAASTGPVSEVPSSPIAVAGSTPVVESQTAPAPQAMPTPQGPVTLDQIVLMPEEVAPACKPLKEPRPVRPDVVGFYEYGSNSMRLPLVFTKAAQGFTCGRDKGAVYYMQYVDEEGRKTAELAARTTLWRGDAQATPRHPEQIFGWDRFLVIVSFKDPAWKSVVAPLVKKLKRLRGAEPTPH